MGMIGELMMVLLLVMRIGWWNGRGGGNRQMRGRNSTNRGKSNSLL
jgi:hypothetical protein